MLKKIFIFYSNLDDAFAKRLLRSMKPIEQKLGYQIFLSNQHIGSNVEEWIEVGISECDILLCLISNNFVSDIYYKFENQINYRGSKHLIPAVIAATSNLEDIFSGQKAVFLKDCKGENDFFVEINKFIKEFSQKPHVKEILKEVSAGHGTNNEVEISNRELPFGIWRFIVKGNSMLPKFENEDVISARYIAENSFYQRKSRVEQLNLEKYFIIEVKDQGLFLKKISIISEYKIELISLNLENSPININVDDILQIWEVIETVRKN